MLVVKSKITVMMTETVSHDVTDFAVMTARDSSIGDGVRTNSS